MPPFVAGESDRPPEVDTGGPLLDSHTTGRADTSSVAGEARGAMRGVARAQSRFGVGGSAYDRADVRGPTPNR